MASGSEKCPVCGSPKSTHLSENCPICLMELATQDGKLLGAAQFAPAGSQRSHVGDGRSQRLGDYELIEEIARGGMGAVYRARQLTLNRTVAIKVLLGNGRFGQDTFIERFRREAEAAASLNHPNIVSIHEVGEHQGQPFFSMELIEGHSLAELTKDNPLPSRRAAQLVKTIAEAVHYAHQRGLLHRDLKPSNVLVDAADIPHVTDFGLAKRMEGEADLTLAGQVLGTPNFMSPEQAEATGGKTTVASDVYSLGAILYQLVTGRPPFLAETITATLRLVVEGEVVSPRLLNPNVSRDLETLCLKCLDREPKRRYASAQDLADELARVLRDEPICARPLNPLSRMGRWCRRKPALASAMGAGAALLLVIAIGSPIAIVRIDAERKQEAGLRVRAELAEQKTEQQLYTALLEQARAIVLNREVGQRVRALDAVRQAAAISNSTALRGVAVAALALPDLRFERELPLETNVTLLELDPRFERLAIGKGTGPVEIRATVDNRLLAVLPAVTNRPAYLGVWSSDGRFLAVKRDYEPSGYQAGLEVWEVAGPRRVLEVPEISWRAIAFHPHRPWLMTGLSDGVAIWDLDSGHEVKRFAFSSESVELVSFSPDGERFVAHQFDPTQSVVSVCSASDGAAILQRGFPELVSMLAWQPGGQWLAIADGANIQLLDPQTGEVRLLGTHKARAVTLAFSPDGHYLMSGGWERELICWDIRARRRAFTIGLDSYELQFSDDGRRCSTVGAMVTSDAARYLHLKLHVFEQPACHREYGEDLGPQLRSAAFSPDGRWLAASATKRVGVWDLTGNELGALDEDAYNTQFCFTADGRELFASRTEERNNECFHWKILPAANPFMPPQLMRLPLSKPDGFTALAVHSNSMVFTGSKGSQFRALEDLENGNSNRWARTSPGLNGISPNGRWLAIRQSFRDTLYVYRLPGLEEVARMKNPPRIGDFQFSPLGDEVATSSSSVREATFWRTETWEKVRTVPNVIGLLYAPDARTLWLTRNWRTAGLYDSTTLELLLPLPLGSLPLAVSQDGRRLAVSVESRHVQVWDVDALRTQLRAIGLDWSDGQSAGAR